MSKQEKARGRRRRQALLDELGGKCVWCGTTEKLEFDCIIPQGDKHHRKDAAARMDFYYAQHRLKNIQILCSEDNRIKSVIDAWFLEKLRKAQAEAAQRQQDRDDVPF